MAVGGAKLLKEVGKRIPEDVSISGFDDILAATVLSPPLTTVAQPGYEMGRAACQLLLHKLGMTAPPQQSFLKLS